MDVSVLPNSNHPERFLQLDVRKLPISHGVFQVGAAITSQRHWQNRLYTQREQGTVSGRHERSSPSPEGTPVMFADRYMEKHITPVTFNPNVKRNPLYTDARPAEREDPEPFKPSWTIKEYDQRSVHGHLAGSMMGEEKTAKDLDYWLEDLYTPGFDSLLKKKEAEYRRRKLCKIFTFVILLISVIIVVVTVPIVLTKKN
ncbi:major intrinsically disordered NOTCH2-binding receptor 1-like [Gadus macrocephalus]|uniref:major intrinsically disordered NOTCH2-binding receptor 1-like n=1 Tax=Gadus chalcogrammus TaxID=1042646 RepID=UPI0024C42DE6|nr:major intrinsically disordered NOTCH2-binding receptor 1-like [Gadus chalcogrammus]XP_059905833.1 major intrinsically disordered NOTCH2-binding receptor 1-like [Gadus macrocephalus]